MARRSDASLAALLLGQRLVANAAPPLKAAEFWPLLARVGDPGPLLGRTAAELTTVLQDAGLDDAALASRVAARFASATGVAFELERLEQSGIRVVTPFDAEYPARIRVRLGAGAPPLLHVVGDAGLLADPALGVVGPHEVDDAGEARSAAAATHATGLGWAVVSGFSPGVDRVAMAAALDAGGRALGFLADPLVAVVRAPELRGAITDRRLYLATPYPPAAPRTEAGALGRNRLIYASARVTFVVSSEVGSGGTWAGASEALRNGYGAVAAWTGPGAGPGNPELVAAGATPVSDVDALLPGDAEVEAGNGNGNSTEPA
ncbi:MAG: recombination-mediator protein [Actinomycetia bacterium]|nr:recombination-mediator protein [Actinomycetes bacterium]